MQRVSERLRRKGKRAQHAPRHIESQKETQVNQSQEDGWVTHTGTGKLQVETMSRQAPRGDRLKRGLRIILSSQRAIAARSARSVEAAPRGRAGAGVISAV